MSEDEKPEISELIAQIKQGSEDAVGLLMEYYTEAIHKVIRRRLNQRMRSQYDTEDFTQIVWASFFGDLNKVATYQTSADLEGFLTAMTRNKVVDACRRHLMRQRTDPDRERRIDTDDSVTTIVLRSADRTPSHIASMREQWDLLLETLPRRHREIIVLRASGCTYKEIAEHVDMNERTIRRIFHSIQNRTPQIPGADADSNVQSM